MQLSRRMDRFEDEIFGALNEKKLALLEQGRKIYNFSIGTPDFETAPHIKQALIDAASDQENWKYSLRDTPEMLDAVCAYYQKRFDVTITPDMICSCYGSQEGIGHIGLVLCDEGDTVILPTPCYPVFIAGMKMAGAEPFYYPMTKENGFLPDVRDIPEEVAKKAKLMIVSLPSNPTGSVGTREVYEEIIAFAKKYDILIIHDNAYSDIIFDGAVGGSFLGIPGAQDVGVEFFSLSKSFNLTGARISFRSAAASAPSVGTFRIPTAVCSSGHRFLQNTPPACSFASISLRKPALSARPALPSGRWEKAMCVSHWFCLRRRSRRPWMPSARAGCCKECSEGDIMQPGTQRVRAEISLSAIDFNMESMRRNLKPGTMMTAVIKTNGYGHGSVPIAQHIERLDYLWGFAVATYEEAVELREAGIHKPVLILGYTFPYCYSELGKLGIRPAVFREDTLKELSAAASGEQDSARIHIAVDTAMSRIGIRPDESGLAFVKKALETPGIAVEGIFTHFSKADEAGEAGAHNTQRQIREFTEFTERIEKELGYRIPVRHCSNSAGIISYRDANLDMVRAGITLYGLWPSGEVPTDIVLLKPVLSLYSHIVYIKEVPAGTAVSYGGTFVTERALTRIATIPVGYGDGYPRSLSNRGYVLIRGRKAGILGRVCMDQFMVDVTDIPEAQEGDQVTLIGTDGQETITMEELGDLSGRFNYELACDLGPRIPRVYTE